MKIHPYTELYRVTNTEFEVKERQDTVTEVLLYFFHLKPQFGTEVRTD